MRRTGMRGSRDLWKWRWAPLIVIGALIAAALIFAQKANSAPYCTSAAPYAPYSNQICIGYGRYCTFGLDCSPVPGTPGTYNPDGYTPCRIQEGCRP